MSASKPFFTAFQRLLFGKPPLSEAEKLLRQEGSSPALSQYHEAFGEFIPKGALELGKSGKNSRARIFPLVVTFWAFLAQVLERGSSCRDALRRIIAWWQLEFPKAVQPSVDTGGYCQARARLPEGVLARIGDATAERLESQIPSSELWLGRRVKILDGTGASMPDTPENQAPGFRTEEVILITTLTDPAAVPLQALADLYFRRWQVELHFREIKTLLGLDVLRCLTPAMVRKEIALHRIAYNLVRLLMQRAALTYHVRLARISFKGTLDSLHHFADAIQALAGHPRRQRQLFDELLLAIARDELPERPGRSEPRVRKRRAKNYHLLTRPRRQMRVPSHRNRPRKTVQRRA